MQLWDFGLLDVQKILTSPTMLLRPAEELQGVD